MSKKMMGLLVLCLLLQVRADRVVVVYTSDGGRDIYNLSDIEKILFDHSGSVTHSVGLPLLRDQFVIKGSHVEFTVSQTSDVLLQVFNARGQIVRSYSKKNCAPGVHRWNPEIKGANATYFVRYSANGITTTGKYTFIR